MKRVAGGLALSLVAFVVHAAVDTTPDTLVLIDKTGVGLGQVITSLPLRVTGINAPAFVSVTGGTYSIGCGSDASYTGASGSINNNETVCVRHTSAPAANTAVNTRLTIGTRSDNFSSITALAGQVVSVMPYAAGNGVVRVVDPAKPATASNPVAVHSGISAEELTDIASFRGAQVSGNTVANLRQARIVYVKGGMLMGGNLTMGANNGIGRFSSIADACDPKGDPAEDLQNPANSWLAVYRKGPDGACFTSDDTVSAVRVNATIATDGVSPPGFRDLKAIHSASGAIVGFLSIEGSPQRVLVHRDANFANPVVMMDLTDYAWRFYEIFPSRIFLAAKPLGQGSQQLFSYDAASNGHTLSPVLYNFSASLDETLAHDASNLYFGDGNRIMRIPRTASAAGQVQTVTTLGAGFSVWSLALPDFAHGRLIFQAVNFSTGNGGVYSVAKTANNSTGATPLHAYAGSSGIYSYPVLATPTGIYINVFDDNTFTVSALRVLSNATGSSSIPNAYWVGGGFSSSCDLMKVGCNKVGPVSYGVLATLNGSSHTLQVVDVATGNPGITLGTVDSTSAGSLMTGFGIGRYMGLTASIQRAAPYPDEDAYLADSQTANSLRSIAPSNQSDFPISLDGAEYH